MDRPCSYRILAAFAVSAAGYALSSFLRGFSAALARMFVVAFETDAMQLGLLGGTYFSSFALLQLPMRSWRPSRPSTVAECGSRRQ